MLNYYQVLEIKTDADPGDIRDAYRKLMRKYHPDLSELPLDEATIKSSELNEAYKVLANQNKRKDYDNLLVLRGEIKAKDSPALSSFEKQSPATDSASKAHGKSHSDSGKGTQTQKKSFSDEEFLLLLTDRSEFRQMLNKYYTLHSTRVRLNWANADMSKYLNRPAKGADSVLGKEVEDLNFYDVELSGSNWSGQVIEKIAFRNSNLKAANFQGAFFCDCEFTDCDFTGANFTGAFIQNPRKIQKCSFANARLDNVTFMGQIVMIRSTSFKGATANGMQFTDLSGRSKPQLRDQVLSCLKEPHWRNVDTEEIIAQIEKGHKKKKRLWPFGKR